MNPSVKYQFHPSYKDPHCVIVSNDPQQMSLEVMRFNTPHRVMPNKNKAFVGRWSSGTSSDFGVECLSQPPRIIQRGKTKVVSICTTTCQLVGVAWRLRFSL
ncbi:hypothetical protein RRG08_031301 [Elysia crispata]|uniref:Uncharacterized protein n=1 Tax=Elysia crispata TaxID=231223 RepID=A0AAE1AIT0_9GAST|nr:hypothetical protein RRG08_031301 [Elysia crispata]